MKEEIDDLIGDLEHEIFLLEKHKADPKEIVAVYKKMQKLVSEQANAYRKKGLDDNSSYIQDLQKQWWEYSDSIIDLMTNTYDKAVKELENAVSLNERWMENAFSDEDLVGAEKYATAIIGFYHDMQDKIHEQANYYRSLGYSDTSEEVSALSLSWWEYADSIEEVKQKIVDNLVDMVDAASDAVDEIQSVFDTFQTAADEYASSGFISVDTFQDIAKMGLQNMQYLKDENGQLVINKDLIYDVIRAKTEQLAVETALNYVERLRLASEKGSVEDINELLYATTETTNATWGLVYANLALTSSAYGWTDRMYQAALQNINAFRALADNVRDGVDVMTGENLDAMRDGVNDILDYVIDMLEDRIKRQVDALEDLKDQYADIIDLKKESLDLSRKESDYQDTVADKVKQIAKLQERITALSLDDSRSAKAQKASLEEELQKLQKELADDQADHAYDAQVDSLDKMQEAYEKEKDAEIKILEDSISSYQKKYDMAIKYIQDHWDTLYGELIDWNTEYGSVLNSEITSAWEACLEAAKRYGSYVAALGALGDSSSGGSGSLSGGSAIGKPSGTVDPTVEDQKRAIITEMYRNTQKWHDPDANKKWLEDRNAELGQQLRNLGIPAYRNDKEGVWYVGGQRLYDAYRQYTKYHTGGVVGDAPDLKQKEVLAVLEKGEVVLDKKKESAVYRLIDFAAMLSDKLGTQIKSLEQLPGITSLQRDKLHALPVGPDHPIETTSNSVVFGNTYIYGGNDETVQKHADVSRRFVNEVLDKLNIKR